MADAVASASRRWLSPPARRRLVSAILAAICCIHVWPLVWMVFASLKPNAEIFAGGGLLPTAPTLENYRRAWTEAHMSSYFLNTVFVTVTSTAIVVLATSTMGYALSRSQFPGRRILFGLLVVTLFVPQGYTIIPIFELLGKLGLSQSLWGLVLATSGGSFVVFVMLFAGYFSQIPKELEEAARMDGVGFSRTFFYVMLPLSKPIAVTVIVLQVLHAWNDFLLPLVVTLANPAIRTLSVGVYAFKGENYIDWGGMTAAATMSILPIVVLFLLLQRYFIDGLAGAVKG